MCHCRHTLTQCDSHRKLWESFSRMNRTLTGKCWSVRREGEVGEQCKWGRLIEVQGQGVPSGVREQQGVIGWQGCPWVTRLEVKLASKIISSRRYLCLKKCCLGTGEIAQWLRVNTAAAEGLSSVPITYCGSSQLSISPAPGDWRPVASTGTCTLMHSPIHRPT